MAKRGTKKKEYEEAKVKYFKAKDLQITLTKIQKPILNHFIENKITILTGDPGTGKTTLALYYAIRQLIDGQFDRIVLFKPCIQIQNLGFTPGTIVEKVEIFRKSYISNIVKIVGESKANDLLKSNKIQFFDIQTARGVTFDDNAIIIADEMQNLSKNDTYTFISRMQDSNKLILLGDEFQVDIKDSGFKFFINGTKKIGGIKHIHLGDEFQMRSKLLVEITKIFKNEKP